MTTRQIEECLDLERMAELSGYWLSVLIPKDCALVVFDPFALHTQDLINAKPGSITLIRARRPFWGSGDLHRYIHILEVPKCPTIPKKN